TRPRMRDRPVASAKMSVETARRRRGAPTAGPAAVSAGSLTRPTIRGAAAGKPCSGTILRPATAGVFTPMPNIKQQKKRVRTAGEERVENLRYRSTIKTLTKRLSAAVEGGDVKVVDAEHKGLVKLIDRAVARGAIHRNTGAR